MKLHIDINTNPLNGYTTIDPIGGDTTKICLDYRNLDSVVQTNECTEIYAPSILNYIHNAELDSIIKHYVSKLRHGGKLIIGGSDIRDIAKKIIKEEISLEDANKLLYGIAPFVWITKRGAYTMYDISSMLKTMGLKIITQKCDETKFIIEAQRD